MSTSQARPAAVTMTVTLAVVLLGIGDARAANPKALILGSTVLPCSATVGCPMSLEEEQAQADGFDTMVVDDATWLAMTGVDFAQYRVLIIGDPSCGR